MKTKNLKSLLQTKQKIISREEGYPSKKSGRDGDFQVRRISGQGVFLFYKWNNKWYSSRLTQYRPKTAEHKEPVKLPIGVKPTKPGELSINSGLVSVSKPGNKTNQIISVDKNNLADITTPAYFKRTDTTDMATDEAKDPTFLIENTGHAHLRFYSPSNVYDQFLSFGRKHPETNNIAAWCMGLDSSANVFRLMFRSSSGSGSSTHGAISNITPSAGDTYEQLSVTSTGILRLGLIQNAGTDTDKFLVSDNANNGYVKFRTGAEVLSDIGAQAAGSYITGSGSLSAQDLTDIGNLSGTNTGDQVIPNNYLRDNADDTTSGTITAAGFTTTGTWTFDDATSGTVGITTVHTGSSFTDNDTSLMTAGAIKEKIEDYSYSTTTGTVTSVGTTGTVNGITLTGTVTSSGNLTLGGTLAINNGDWSGTALADGNIASASTWNAKQDELTFGISNTNAVKIDDANVADDEYARFTANGLESRTLGEIKTDIGTGNSALVPSAGTSGHFLAHNGAFAQVAYSNLSGTPTIPTNYVTNDADDTMAGTLTIDKDSTATTTGPAHGIFIDYDHTGITASGQTIKNIGVSINMLNDSVTHVGTHVNYGISSSVRSNTTGASSVYGIRTSADTADTVYGIYNIATGAGTAGYGIYQKVDDGDTDYIQVSSANTADYFSMVTGEDGETTLATVEDGLGMTAHMTLDADGDITLDAASGNIYVKDNGGNYTPGSDYEIATKKYVDDNDANDNTQNTYASSWVDSSDDVLLRLTTGGAGSGTQDIKLVAGTGISLTPSGTNMTIANTVSAPTDYLTNNAADIMEVSDFGAVAALKIDADQPATTAAEDSKGLWIDYDRVNASSGTNVHNDIGIDLDLNTASRGDSFAVGLDLDVVGASGTSYGSSHQSTGIDVNVSGSNVNRGLNITVPDGNNDYHMRLFAADDVNDYATISVKDTGDLYITTEDNAGGDGNIYLDADGDVTISTDATAGTQGEITLDATLAINLDSAYTGGSSIHFEQATSIWGFLSRSNSGASTNFRLYEGANLGTYTDYFQITSLEHGATTISTVDDNAAAAHLTIEPDGDMIFKSDGLVLQDNGDVSTPASGYGTLYVNSDVLYFKTDGGTATNLLAGGGSGDMTGVDLTAGTGISIDSETNTTSGDYSATITCNVEGTEIVSTGEGGGSKFLREDGDGTCSWQTVSGGGGISWDGSTANGVATYKDADEATVESNLTFDGTDLSIAGTGKLILGAGDTSISESAADVLNLTVGGQNMMLFTEAPGGAGTIEFDNCSTGVIIGQGTKLYLDGGSNTYVESNAADSIVMACGSATMLTLKEDGATNGDYATFGTTAAGFTQFEPTYNATDTYVYFNRAGNKANLTFGAASTAIVDIHMHFPPVSGNFTLLIKQHSSGGGSVTNWKTFDKAGSNESTVVWAGGSAPTLTTGANKIDIISVYWDADNNKAYGVASLNF